MTIGIFAGSFDPFTLGHLDILKRSLLLCSKVIVAVGVNSAKNSFFTLDQKVNMINQIVATELNWTNNCKVFVESFHGLLVDFVKERDADLIIRGIRSFKDFEYETNLAEVNRSLDPPINGRHAFETVFLYTKPELAMISSSMVKELAKYGKDVSPFVPSIVAKSIPGQLCFRPI